jgi:hypothetical protein
VVVPVLEGEGRESMIEEEEPGTETKEFVMGGGVAKEQVEAEVCEVRMIFGQEVGRCGRRTWSSGVEPEKVIRRMRSCWRSVNLWFVLIRVAGKCA